MVRGSKHSAGDLNKLGDSELLELWDRLGREGREAAHRVARQDILKAGARGRVTPDQDRLEHIRQVRKEIDRRVQAGGLDDVALSVIQKYPREQWDQLTCDLSRLRQGTVTGTKPTQLPGRRGARQQSGVAARRAVVRANLTLSDQDICRRLDLDSIPLPWTNHPNWITAYHDTQCRKRIHVIFAKDRGQG